MLYVSLTIKLLTTLAPSKIAIAIEEGEREKKRVRENQDFKTNDADF